MIRRTLRRLRHDDRGQTTPWTAVGVLVVIILAGVVLDLGLGMSDKVRILDLAQAAARAGAREIDLATYRTTGDVYLDPARAAETARAFLHQTGLPAGQATATASTTTVTVTITTTRRTQLLHLAGITNLPVAATATATPLTGVTTAT